MQLSKITIATTKTLEMVEFYNAVFFADLQSASAFGTTIYRGKVAGLEFMLCPNTVVGVQAQKNRQQFRFQVPNIDAVVRRIVEHGGAVIGHIEEDSDGTRYIAGRDPDGNTIEFEQPSAARVS